MTKTKKTKDEVPFEASMEELEAVVSKLEAGDVPLEESLEAFEKGVALVRKLHARLDGVEKKIEELTLKQDGSVEIKPLDPSS